MTRKDAFNPYLGRWVVLDTETTGLVPTRDHIVSIGAVAVREGEIDPMDSFECVIRQPFNSSSVVVHGITQGESERRGVPERDALESFLRYLGDSSIVGHHIAFDIAILDHAFRKHFRQGLENAWIDTMGLVIGMRESGVIDSPETGGDFSLDGLCRHFGVKRSGRHTAPGDAFLTAVIFIRLLHFCERRAPDLVNGLMRQGVEDAKR